MRALSGRNRRLAWLGLTPDPERLLPGHVARLRHARFSGTSVADLEIAERGRVERLILHGTPRRWLRYLGELTTLVVAVADGGPGDPHTAREVGDVIRHHHRMLIGLPGPGYQRTGAQRAALDDALLRLESR
ncbi:hypothetical protein ACQPZX_33465 [Actinoplanes sp. CA-142083]|uniref:hypothetical protein n=1 Tax=Actinoplanes sp. CA-142083 TaxID=3239903 RepID=UPI003D9405D9